MPQQYVYRDLLPEQYTTVQTVAVQLRMSVHKPFIAILQEV